MRAVEEQRLAADDHRSHVTHTATALRARVTGKHATISAISLTVLVGTVVRLPQLGRGLNELFGFRQTQTAFTIREYARSGIDLFHPLLPILGRPWVVPIEFPLFQALGALFVKAGLSSDYASRLLGLISFQVCAVLLAVLLAKWAGRAIAVVAVLLFEFTPFGVQWGSASLIEFFSVAFCLGMVIGLWNWFERGSRWGLALGSACAWCAYLVKPTAAVPWCVPVLAGALVFVPLTTWRMAWNRAMTGLVVGPAIGLGLGLSWARYADSQKEANPFTVFLTSGQLTSWIFGTRGQRLDPSHWSVIFGRIADLIGGPALILIVVAVILIIVTPQNRVLLLSVAAVPIVGIGIFFNLFAVHDYYLSEAYPALVATVAIGIVYTARRLSVQSGPAIAVAAVLTVAVLAATWTSDRGTVYAAALRSKPQRPAGSAVIKAGTPAGAHVVVIGCDWDPTTLYYADRRGLMLRPGPVPISASELLAGYRYAYVCDPAKLSTVALPSGVALSDLGNGLYDLVRAK